MAAFRATEAMSVTYAALGYSHNPLQKSYQQIAKLSSQCARSVISGKGEGYCDNKIYVFKLHLLCSFGNAFVESTLEKKRIVFAFLIEFLFASSYEYIWAHLQ